MARRSLGHTRALARPAALILAAALMTAAACGGRPESTETTAGGVVRLPIPAEPADLSFVRARGRWSVILTELIGDSLVGLDAQLRPVPRLAKSWQWSPDHRVLTFQLRPDTRWHDGKPVTAADVVHTWRALTDPELGPSSWTPAFKLIRRVVALDPGSVRVEYDEPYAAALVGWGAPLVPSHRPAEDPELIGCGPWKLARRERGQRIELVANREHYAAPRLARLVLEVIPDPSTRFAALRSGEVDFCGLLPRQFERLEQDPELQQRFGVVSYRVLYLFYIAWKDAGPGSLFHSPEVRRAMSLAIDRQGYIDRFMGGQASPGITVVHPDSWAFSSEVKAWPWDPGRARELLAEKGFIDRDGDGIRERNGRDFSFRLVYASGSPQTEQVAAFVGQQLAAIGVEVRLVGLEWARFLEAARERRDYDAVMVGWGLDVDPDPYELIDSSQAEAGGANYALLRDAEVDGLVREARGTVDRGHRRELYARLQQRLRQLEPQTVLFYPVSRMAYDRRLEGVEGTPIGPLRFIPGSAAWSWSETPRRGGLR